MKTKACLIILLALAASSASGAADTDDTAGGLRIDCTANEPFGRGQCLGYVLGVAESTLPAACLPYPRWKMVSEVVHWLNNHPAQLRESRLDAVKAALKEAFPCKEGGKR